jgi:hypothetical protein
MIASAKLQVISEYRDVMANRLNSLLGVVERAALSEEARQAYMRVLGQQAQLAGLVRQCAS